MKKIVKLVSAVVLVIGIIFLLFRIGYVDTSSESFSIIQLIKLLLPGIILSGIGVLGFVLYDNMK